MPRARTVKPEFFRDKKMGAAGPTAALVYQALWIVADDGGMADCTPELLKGEMFAYWPAVGVPEITEALRHLFRSGRVVFFASHDRTFAQILSWDQHQHVHKPSQFRYSNSLKDFAETVPEWCGTSAGIVRDSPDSLIPLFPSSLVPSNTTPEPVPHHSGTTPTVSGNGTHKPLALARVAEEPASTEPWEAVALRIREKVSLQKSDVEAAGKVVLAYFNARMQTQFRWGGKSTEKILARLRETRNASTLFYAIDGATKDDNIMGRRSDSQGGYKRPVTIFRDDAQVDRFVEAMPKDRPAVHPVFAEMLAGAAP